MRGAGESRHPDAILVMDVDDTVRDIVAELASAEGMRALPVAGEEEARLVLATYPGLVPFLILDLRLVSGSETAASGGDLAVFGGDLAVSGDDLAVSGDDLAVFGAAFALGARLASLRTGIRILYLSSHPREDFREFAKLRGEDAFLPKPFQLEALRDLIRGAPAPATIK